MNETVKRIYRNYEPKKKNRFFVTFPEEYNIAHDVVLTCNKPKFSEGKWDDINIEFHDPIGPSTSQGLFELVHIMKKNRFSFFKFIIKQKPLFIFTIQMLDPVGIVVENWTISVDKILRINFDDCDYNSDDLCKPSIHLKPLKCVLNY